MAKHGGGSNDDSNNNGKIPVLPGQMNLFDRSKSTPPSGDRGGVTYEHKLDYARLNKQARDVWAAMRDLRWHTLAALAAQTGHPEASISARLRDFRKARFGAHTVERERVADTGLFQYRLIPSTPANKPDDDDWL